MVVSVKSGSRRRNGQLEVVMIGTASTQGISFTSPARVLKEKH